MANGHHAGDALMNCPGLLTQLVSLLIYIAMEILSRLSNLKKVAPDSKTRNCSFFGEYSKLL
jgi:hypothetical protein